MRVDPFRRSADISRDLVFSNENANDAGLSPIQLFGKAKATPFQREILGSTKYPRQIASRVVSVFTNIRDLL